jgi:hypothetical protein
MGSSQSCQASEPGFEPLALHSTEETKKSRRWTHGPKMAGSGLFSARWKNNWQVAFFCPNPQNQIQNQFTEDMYLMFSFF